MDDTRILSLSKKPLPLAAFFDSTHDGRKPVKIDVPRDTLFLLLMLVWEYLTDSKGGYLRWLGCAKRVFFLWQLTHPPTLRSNQLLVGTSGKEALCPPLRT